MDWEEHLAVKTFVERSRAWLNDHSLVDKGVKRLYVDSAADRAVGLRGVERHDDEARTKGPDVRIRSKKDRACSAHATR